MDSPAGWIQTNAEAWYGTDINRRRQTIRIAAGVINAVVLVHAAIAIGMLREGYRLTVIFNPLEWSYNRAYTDGQIIDNHRHFEKSHQYGFLNFTKGSTVRID